jgi:hypothetical protein
MRTENYGRTLRDFIRLVNKNGAFCFQLSNHKLVMNYFFAHINWGAMQRKGLFHSFHSAVNSRTIAARLS